MSTLPPLNALRAFDVAGRHLKFRAAAEDIGVTQGAIAQQVRALEAHLGLPLFERHPRGLSFTPEGRLYHARVARAFGDLHEATAALRPEPGQVLISVTPSFAAKWLIPNLPSFAETHHDIDLRILATEKISRFHSDGVDLAVRQGQPPFGAALESRFLFAQEIIAVAAPAMLQGLEPPLSPQALAGLPRLYDAHDHWPDFLVALGVTETGGRGFRLSQTALAIDAALSGQGVALVSRFLVQRDLDAGRLVAVIDLTLTGAQDFYLLAMRSRKRSPAVTAVLDWMSAAAARETKSPQ